MVSWLNAELSEHYTLVKTLKENPNSCVQVLRHDTLHANIVKRTYTGSAEVYLLLRGISHKNLPIVYEVTEEAPTVLVLEEYIDGTTIAEGLQGRTYTEEEARKVMLALCDTLSVLHSLGIIHRDIKPENVMIERGGTVKLIDFNAAKFYKAYKANDTMVIGTTGFAAPEQFGIAQSDERTDLFSLGILLNVMLTGEHPSRKLYPGKHFARIIEKCIQVAPNKRYPDALSLAKELR